MSFRRERSPGNKRHFSRTVSAAPNLTPISDNNNIDEDSPSRSSSTNNRAADSQSKRSIHIWSPGRESTTSANTLKNAPIRHRRSSLSLPRDTGNILNPSTANFEQMWNEFARRKSVERADKKKGIISEMETTNEKKKDKKSPYENLVDWSLVTNVHGSYYVLEQGVHPLSNLFWAFVYLLLWSISFYLIGITYIGWRDNPVVTTVSTTALPIEEVEFPVITICGQGTIKETVEIAYLNQITNYLRNKGVQFELNSSTSSIELLDKYGHDFILEKYPGAILSPVKMVEAMLSQNPIQRLRAQIVVSGGYDACADQQYLKLNSSNITNSSSSYNNSSTFINDPVMETSYEYVNKSVEQKEGTNICWNKLGNMFYPFSDRQLLGIIRFIKEGPLEALQDGQPFWVDLTGSNDGTYRLLDGQKLVNDSFKFLNITSENIDDPTKRCFIMHYSFEFKMFIGMPASCLDTYPTLCYLLQQHESNCTASYNTTRKDFQDNGENINLIDRLLDPRTRSNINKEVAKKKEMYLKAFNLLDLKAAYSSLFELLWYSQLPCFDVKGFFDKPDQRSLLKQCTWKGINIPCAAIFSTVPTDRGMCCTFNMKAADEIFNNSPYQTMISTLQENDKKNSHNYSGLPNWYQKASEPSSQRGVSRGLSIMLDAHNDLIGSSTVNEDFQGFIAIVSGRNGYPLSEQDNIRISPGYETLVALSAVDIQADLKDMKVKDRQCYYPHGEEEDKIMVAHRSYSQSSCILECQITYAMDKMMKVGEEPCIPWYLPTINDAKMCNPWSAIAFREQIDLIPNDQCKHCLPDCKSTLYNQYVSSAPFRRCDNKNLGISPLCNLDDSTLPEPPIFGTQVQNEYEGLSTLPAYVKNIQSTERFYSKPNEIIFRKSFKKKKYDAYKKDIAVVQFYFDSSTIFQYSRQAKMSWVDFVAQIGGLMGVCLGYSISMFIEQCYWYFFRVWIDVRI